MSKFFQHPAVRRVRTAFRWCRISLWMLVLLAMVAVAYLHTIGLPDFAKRPMLQRLLDKGIRAEFSNMQLGWDRGPSILIEMPAFSNPNQTLSPRLTADRAELAVSLKPLLHGQIQLRSLDVDGAELKLPVSQSPKDALIVKDVSVSLEFNANDVLRLDRCEGNFRGIRVDFLATVNHASEMRNWQLPSAQHNNAIDWPTTLRRIAKIVDNIHFTGFPLLQIEAGGDGRDMNSAHVEMHFSAMGASTPWGGGVKLSFQAACARLMRPGTQPFFRAEFSASNLKTPWAEGRQISFLTTLARTADSNYDAELQLDSPWLNRSEAVAGSNWIRAQNLSCDGRVTLTSSNWIPLQASANLRGGIVRGRPGSVERLSVQCRAQPARDLPPLKEISGPWKNLAGWKILCEANGRHLENPKLHIDSFSFDARWLAPRLVIENFRAGLYGGNAAADAALDVGTRELRVSGIADFNPKSIGPLLHPSEQKFLEQLDWPVPPKIKADFRIVLPPWQNRPSNWAEDASASMQIAGEFTVGTASFQGVAVSSANGHITLTNLVWNASQLHVIRPDGYADLNYTASARAQAYRLLVDSHLNPADALPIAAPGKPHLLDGFSFTQAPAIHADIKGYWREPQRNTAIGVVRATNFTFRGVRMEVFNADVNYTNFQLALTNLFVSGSQCQIVAPWVRADLLSKRITVSNALGRIDAPVLQRLLVKNRPLFLDYLHFESPPSVSVSGSFSLTNQFGNDLHFLVNCGAVHFTNLVADRVSATVDWTGQFVSVTNIFATAYRGGTLMGWIVFDNDPKGHADFTLDLSVRDLDLSAVARGVSGKTNRLEGRFDGDIGLSAPDLSDKKTWNGRGHVHVHDALLWDIKIFGLLSPVLNAIAPGWGHSRAREALANFTIANGAVSTDDMVVRSSGFRLNFRGSIDQDKRIKAKLEASLARDAPVVGPFLSFALTPLSKLFEYHISGTLQNPVLEPVFIPRFLLHMLHPFKSLKGSQPTK